MLLVKSVFAGVIATCVAAIVAVCGLMAWLLFFKSRNLPEGYAVGWDPVSLFRFSWFSALSWLILIGAFVLGFAWEYRRAN